MAKIVTITNPLTGQPAQVDQLDHTAQQIDDGLNIARGVSNPNLLDNWYFGNPVDQRKGYVITPNTRIYSDAGLTNLLATAGPNEYVQIQTVTEITDTYAKFIDSGGSVRYTEAAQAPVRGYTGAGYGIDRWYQNLNSVILITDAGLVMNSTSGESYFFQHIEDDVSGKMVTFSALFEDGTLLTGTGIAPTSIGVVNIAVGNKNRLYLERSAQYALTAVCAIAENANSKCIAAKLELGTQQTLAHQDADGNWVLNELPNYADTLARCQYYSDLPTTWVPMTFYVADFVVFTVKTHREMRVNLSSANVTLDSSKLEVHSNGAAQSGFTFSVYGGGDDYILVKAAKSGHGLSNALLVVNNGGIYANANL